MQVLKDAVRQNIRSAAIKTFKDQGYQKASMRVIADEAGMSVGNLYRYYKNKEALFGELVKPMVDFFLNHEKREKQMNLEMVDVSLLDNSVFIESLVEARLDFREELFILFLRAEGSSYEGAKEYLRSFLQAQAQAFYDQHFSGEEILKGSTYLKAVAGGLVEAFCTILEESESDKDFYLNILEFMELMVKPSIRNLLAIRDHTTQFRRISDEEVIKFFSHHRSTGNYCGAESDGEG